MRRPHHRSEGEMAIAKRTAKLTAKSAGTMPLPEPNLKAIMSGIEIAGTEANSGSVPGRANMAFARHKPAKSLMQKSLI